MDDPVRIMEPVWIPVRGGLKLAARLWIPDGATDERYPAVLEYIPYRTFDRYRALDDRWGKALAAQGIVFARVDIRGSGNSEGLLEDEYLASEQEDACDVIAWLAAQPWCNGAVGMRGISWGGFAALQVAALRPPALKAIVAMCATDSRFRNDAHYVGGLPGLTNLKWAAGFELVMASPPDPAVIGDQWEESWRARLEATPSIAARWLAHDWSDAYWRHGSVGLEPDMIACPVLLVGGWADPYTQSLERVFADLEAPVEAIVGPWGHTYPDLAQPGPGLDWQKEEIRWWRRWLCDCVDDEDVPKLRFFLAETTPAQTGMKELPGHWTAERTWPSPHIREETLHLASGGLSNEPASGGLAYSGTKIVGLATPEWIPYASSELPRDQSEDDARSLVFEFVLDAPRDVVGVPRLRLRLASDKPLAAVAARLCEVDAEGRSWLVSYAILNLCFSNGFDAEPSRLEPGTLYDVELALAPVAHRFDAGARLRLALSDGLWPLTWPAPERATLTFELAGCALHLPVRAYAADQVFPMRLQRGGFSRGEPTLAIDERGGGSAIVTGRWSEWSQEIAATKTVLSGNGPDMELFCDPAEPLRTRWRVSQSSRYRRDAWDCEVRAEIVMSATRTHYIIEERLEAMKNERPLFSRTRRDEIPRRFS